MSAVLSRWEPVSAKLAERFAEEMQKISESSVQFTNSTALHATALGLGMQPPLIASDISSVLDYDTRSALLSNPLSAVDSGAISTLARDSFVGSFSEAIRAMAVPVPDIWGIEQIAGAISASNSALALPVSETLIELAKVQVMHAESVQHMANFFASSAVAPNLLWNLIQSGQTVSRILAGMGEVASIDVQSLDLSQRLQSDLIRLGSAYSSYAVDGYSGLAALKVDFSWPGLARKYFREEIDFPSRATDVALYSGRMILEGSKHGENVQAIPHAYHPPLYANDLFDDLFEDKPYLREMRQGAWDALHSRRPHSKSQAAHSARELIMQSLDLLAPDILFSPEELGERKQPTRRLRLQRALTGAGKHEIAWIDNLIGTVLDMYNHVTEISHFRSDSDDISSDDLYFLLLALDGVLGLVFHKATASHVG